MLIINNAEGKQQEVLMKVKIDALLDLIQDELEGEQVTLVQQGALKRLRVFRGSLGQYADKNVEVSKPRMSEAAADLLKDTEEPDGSASATAVED